MPCPPDELETLLQHARQYADDAVAHNDPLLYREAFQIMCQAVELMLRERNNWREQVRRATEEFSRTEGV